MEELKQNVIKKCINYRLLKYPLVGYDYTKINNKAYNTRKYTQLFANYIWNETNNIDLITKILLKYSKQKIFNIITNNLSFLVPVYEKEYNLDISTSEKYRILIFEKEPRLCKHCSNRVLTDNIFCSVKCLNQHKATDEKYLTNLSNAQKEYYKTVNNSELEERHSNIKNTLINFNSSLTDEEKSEKYTNKTIVYDSYDNRIEQFSHLTFLFNKEFYYNNKYLPVQCNICGFKWDMTRSTSIGRTICIKCFPQEKAKTQRIVFDYIYNLTHCKNNDRSFIKDLEIDILVDTHKFCVEYNGLLPHSFGDSKISYYNNRNIYRDYHLRKTELVEEKGYKLFHIFENEWLDEKKQKIWISIINSKLNLCEEISAEKYIIKEIDTEASNEFLNENHLSGGCLATISLGLFDNNNLMSVMLIQNNSKDEWEIIRFANKLDYHVFEGESKLLNYFEVNYKPKSIFMHTDRRWEHNSEVEALGFEFICNTGPRCFKFKINENELNILDESNIDLDKLFDNGYRIIFDSGTKKYIKTIK